MARVVLKLGDDISTDIIYPGRFMATVLPSETARYAFADEVEFNRKLRAGEIAPGSIILGGNNFGSGSSREQAASALKGCGLLVAAKGFARIFRQNAVNLGLSTVECPEIEAELGDELIIQPHQVENRTTGRSYPVIPLTAVRQAIVDAGGLICYTRERLLAERK